MRVQIIQIGNSKGIRIPGPILAKCQLEEEVELEAQPGQLVVRSVGGPRHGWAATFKKMARRSDDRLLNRGEPTTQWSRKNWKW